MQETKYNDQLMIKDTPAEPLRQSSKEDFLVPNYCELHWFPVPYSKEDLAKVKGKSQDKRRRYTERPVFVKRDTRVPATEADHAALDAAAMKRARKRVRNNERAKHGAFWEQQ